MRLTGAELRDSECSGELHSDKIANSCENRMHDQTADLSRTEQRYLVFRRSQVVRMPSSLPVSKSGTESLLVAAQERIDAVPRRFSTCTHPCREWAVPLTNVE